MPTTFHLFAFDPLLTKRSATSSSTALLRGVELSGMGTPRQLYSHLLGSTINQAWKQNHLQCNSRQHHSHYILCKQCPLWSAWKTGYTCVCACMHMCTYLHTHTHLHFYCICLWKFIEKAKFHTQERGVRVYSRKRQATYLYSIYWKITLNISHQVLDHSGQKCSFSSSEAMKLLFVLQLRQS